MKKLLVFAMGWAVAIGCGARDSDGIDDAFMTSEVGVTGGIEESGPEARAILWVANQASQQSLLADVGLTATTAAEIVAARGLARFKSLAQLDDVPYVESRSVLAVARLRHEKRPGQRRSSSDLPFR